MKKSILPDSNRYRKHRLNFKSNASTNFAKYKKKKPRKWKTWVARKYLNKIRGLKFFDVLGQSPAAGYRKFINERRKRRPLRSKGRARLQKFIPVKLPQRSLSRLLYEHGFTRTPASGKQLVQNRGMLFMCQKLKTSLAENIPHAGLIFSVKQLACMQRVSVLQHTPTAAIRFFDFSGAVVNYKIFTFCVFNMLKSSLRAQKRR